MKFSDNLGSPDTYFKLLAETIPHLVWTTDQNGEADYFNQRWYIYTGCAPGESFGHDWQKWIHDDDLQRCLANWKSALESGEGYETEYRARRHDGVYRWHLARAMPVRDEGGDVVKWFGTSTDVHNHKTLLEEREALTTAIAHDLKSPLVGTNLILDMLASKKLGELNEKQHELVTQILASNKKMLTLLQSLLDFYREDLNTHNLTMNSFDFTALALDCVSDMQVQAESRGIKLRLHSDIRDCFVPFDPLAIRRVLQNLLDNAIKFSPEGGEVKVHLSRRGDNFELVVEDFGAGIEPELCSRLFNPFTQGANGRRYRLGSGLGLYLSRQIIEAYKGTICCESELGAGSKFIVRLPAKARI